MKKEFEDYLSELQTDMVAISLEYVEDRADDIFIYCSYEPEAYYFNVFFRLQGKLVLKHQLNDVPDDFTYDTSTERQLALQRIGVQNLEEIHKKCKEYGRDMPSEIKLHYNVKQNSLKAKYNYDIVYSNDDELLPKDIFIRWLEEVKNNL
ncbi:DUF600 domain-containing protein [Gracilibacillus saliphilus]|uniref:DUF600 domain-containing protein n=1 Tax=Gracilibacillus saliphilus TaxID=543890 RepID=UPI0013D6697C|nr:DUF600 domain-containing protein [Gracilibacillus saliphilus]